MVVVVIVIAGPAVVAAAVAVIAYDSVVARGNYGGAIFYVDCSQKYLWQPCPILSLFELKLSKFYNGRFF